MSAPTIPDESTVAAIAAEVHAHDCGCPDGWPSHDEHIHQNQVWVTTVLACARRLGYRITQEATP